MNQKERDELTGIIKQLQAVVKASKPKPMAKPRRPVVKKGKGTGTGTQLKQDKSGQLTMPGKRKKGLTRG